MDKQKMAIVADKVAMFQAELERAYKAAGVKYDGSIQSITMNYAQALMAQAGLMELNLGEE